MSLKKYLQQLQDEQAEELLTESDEQFCRQLAAQVHEKPAKSKPKIKIWAGIGSALAVALVAVIVIPFALKNKPVNEVTYSIENIDSISCNLVELNLNTEYFIVEQNDGYTISSALYYDTKSNDKLFYEVEVTFSAISKVKLDIVVNKNYNYEFDFNGELLIEPLVGYTINYSSLELDNFSTAQAKYKGYIQIDTEIVYIQYEQVVDLGEQAFFDDIQSVLKVKN